MILILGKISLMNYASKKLTVAEEIFMFNRKETQTTYSELYIFENFIDKADYC